MIFVRPVSTSMPATANSSGIIDFRSRSKPGVMASLNNVTEPTNRKLFAPNIFNVKVEISRLLTRRGKILCNEIESRNPWAKIFR